jgi:uncharacterized membrane protein SpoIIM required for sporulation
MPRKQYPYSNDKPVPKDVTIISAMPRMQVPGKRTAPRSEDWEQLRILLGRVDAGGLKALREIELWELPSLYRKTLTDLSLLRDQGTAPGLVDELSSLCNRAHAVIYRGVARKRGPGILNFIACELPRAVRRRAGFIWAAAAVMVLFAVIAWFNCSLAPPTAKAVLESFGPNMLREWETALQTAHEQQDLRLAAQIDEEQRSYAAVAITANNIQVSVMAFVLGIAGGIPTLLLLGLNGYVLGAIAYLYFMTVPGIEINLPLYFIAGVAPHGSIELPAICLAGAAGMILGFSWLLPGQRSRGEALRNAAVDAGRLVLTCSLTLVVAGLIEGFITPMYPPPAVPLDTWFWLKIAFGALVFTLWLAWLLLGGRNESRLADSRK